MAKYEMKPKEKYLVFQNAAIVALAAVKNNYANDKYDTKDWFPLGASYFGVKGVKGKALEALKDFGFFSNYGGGVKFRMPSGQSANVGDQMAEDFEEVFHFKLKEMGFDQEVETFTDSWYN